MKKIRKRLAGLLLLALLFFVGRMLLIPVLPERECEETGAACMACYLLNLDGMKGLGHAALLLVDEEGRGSLLSYNGMQYNLFWSLTGRAGVGKMMEYHLEPEEVELLFRTGDVEIQGYEECDNFDRILYRRITEEQHRQIREAAEVYKSAGEEYEERYAALQNAKAEDLAEAEVQMEQFLERDLPRYQIYTHNCDTAARELLALVDEEVRQYQASHAALTPNGNYKKMCKTFSTVWGYGILGEDRLLERVLGRL